MASRIHTRSISRGGSQDHSSTHSQTQSGTHSGTRSGSHSGTHSDTHSGTRNGTRSSSESQSRSHHSTTTEPTRTTSIARGPNVQTENVSGSETTSTRYEDIAFNVKVSIPVEGGLYFDGT